MCWFDPIVQSINWDNGDYRVYHEIYRPFVLFIYTYFIAGNADEIVIFACCMNIYDSFPVVIKERPDAGRGHIFFVESMCVTTSHASLS